MKQFKKAEKEIKNIQNKTLAMLEFESSSIKWQEHNWLYEKGKGGGLTIIGSDEKIIEKAGVNFSSIANETMIDAAIKTRPNLKDAAFEVCGTSIIVHPKNPFVPTAHANFRYFQAKTKKGEIIWWFGGGFDLTPYYPFEEDCEYWHNETKKTCDNYGHTVYPDFKNWCDDYFYLPHRKEPRGIGGIFFDDLNDWGFDACLKFIIESSNTFINSYQFILSSRKNTPYQPHHESFKCYRRGRYVEFNLLYDRGTKFGLDSGGRTESILASLPPKVYWQPNTTFYKDEALLLKILNIKEWC